MDKYKRIYSQFMISFLEDAILYEISLNSKSRNEQFAKTISILYSSSYKFASDKHARSNNLITLAFVSASGYSKLVEHDVRIIYTFHIFERKLAEMRGGKNGVRNDRALLPGNSFNKSTTVNRPRIRAHVAQSLSVH